MSFRVLLLIDSMRMGGAERITAALLPYLDRARITPILGVMSSEGESRLTEQIRDVHRIDLNAARLLDPAAFRRLLHVIREEKIDLIHAQLQYATVFATLAHRLTGAPVVVTRHLIADDASNWRERVRSKIEQWLITRYVSRVITVSDASQHYYAKQAGLPASRFQTIYNGIDLERFSPADDKIAVRRRLGLPELSPIVIMVGVMRPGKGHEVLIDAARHIPEAVFVLVGDGPNRGMLERQAASLGERVIFLGERMDVPELLRAADLFALPSDSEALPTVLIEAGASGLPSVATCVGGVPEVVADGQTGIIVPPRDPASLAAAISGLLAEPDRLKEMGRAAFALVHRKFTLSGQAEATMTLYEQVIQESLRRDVGR